MPIAYLPPAPTSADTIVPEVVVDDDKVIKGQAVAVVYDEAQQRPEIRLCSSRVSEHGLQFYGFVEKDSDPNSEKVSYADVVTRRGAVVEPVIKDKEKLTPGKPVFLSAEKGSVTQVAPEMPKPGFALLYLGFAISEKEMVLAPDTKHLL
jgi:hypothetical protein